MFNSHIFIDMNVSCCYYTYIFSNDLFIKDGIYTISVSTTDEAGNVNDTRLGKDTDEIRFAVKKGSEASYNKK